MEYKITIVLMGHGHWSAYLQTDWMRENKIQWNLGNLELRNDPIDQPFRFSFDLDQDQVNTHKKLFKTLDEKWKIWDWVHIEKYEVEFSFGF